MAKCVLKNAKKKEEEEDLKMMKISRKISHISLNIGPNQLKFRLVIGFGHRMLHAKFQLECSKST